MLGTVIAVLAALGVGGILGGWLAARRERAETFRARMVDTCVEFLAKQAEARAGLADTQAGVLDRMPRRLDTDDLKGAVQRITDEANEQHQRFCWAANRAIRGCAF